MQKLFSVVLVFVAALTCGLIANAVLVSAPDEEPFAQLVEPNGRVVRIGAPELVTPTRAYGMYEASFEHLVLQFADQSLHLYNPKTKKVVKLVQQQGLEFVGYVPKGNTCYYTDSSETLYAGFLGDQTLRKVAQVPVGVDTDDYVVTMGESNEIWLRTYGKNKPTYRLVNGNWTQAEYKATAAEEPDPGVYVVFAPEYEGQSNRDKGQVLQISFNEDAPGEVITTGVTEAEITPDGKFLFFQSQGHMFVCKVSILTGAEAKAALVLDAKKEAMISAKNVSVGLLLYAGDNDEMVPGQDQFEAILPYLKDAQMMKNFVYTYSGPLDLSKLEKPAETEIGYVLGPGGRAVAYADGHVKWFPDQQVKPPAGILAGGEGVLSAGHG